MSRAGYSDDCQGRELNMWRGAVNAAIKGKRGQAFMREVLATLDAMPEKRLAANSLQESASGAFCTLGAVGAARGIDLKPLEEQERGTVADAFGIAEALAAEIMHENDDGCGDSYWLGGGGYYGPKPPVTTIEEKRWKAMRAWVVSHITPTPPAQAEGSGS
jgi:hypothetical protein